MFYVIIGSTVDGCIVISRIVFMLIFWDTKVAACIGNCRNMQHIKISNGQVRVYESAMEYLTVIAQQVTTMVLFCIKVKGSFHIEQEWMLLIHCN